MTVQDVIFGQGATPSIAYSGIWNRLSRRDDIVAAPNLACDWVRKTVLELTATFPFQALQKTAPIFTLTPGTNQYTYLQILGNATDIPNLIPSFFMFYNTNQTSGIQLKYKSMDSLELMFSTQGTPAYWSRFGNQFFVAPTPIQGYQVRVRYQTEHPFTDPPALTDNIMMPDDWLDIVEIAASERGAADLRMLDYAGQYHTMLFGDPEFERTSGATGNPGLIFRRTSQMESDLTSQMRSIRVQRSR